MPLKSLSRLKPCRHTMEVCWGAGTGRKCRARVVQVEVTSSIPSLLPNAGTSMLGANTVELEQLFDD